MRKVLVVGLWLTLLVGFSGCNKPTESECQKSCDHMKNLVIAKRIANTKSDQKVAAKKIADEYMQKNAFHVKECVSTCRRKGTKKVVDCILNRKDYDELKQCKGK
ncbi:MAG: hypothetical protein KC609_00225 [Myxococcales bacterium]|nr:hypothetical protein [Myxococcales bacterium]